MSEPEPVCAAEIARRIGYSSHAVGDWANGKDDTFPPFPPPRWRTRDGRRLWDWRVVGAWVERTRRAEGAVMAERVYQDGPTLFDWLEPSWVLDERRSTPTPRHNSYGDAISRPDSPMLKRRRLAVARRATLDADKPKPIASGMAFERRPVNVDDARARAAGAAW